MLQGLIVDECCKWHIQKQYAESDMYVEDV